MIVVTGGAGFIGSAVIWALNGRGVDDIMVVDSLDRTSKWKNLVPLKFIYYMDKEEFIIKLEAGRLGELEAIIHMGACSSTTEDDSAYLMENNYRYTARIAAWVTGSSPGTRLIYASSAATYGDGANGYGDDEDALHHLRPLNMYGYSKHLFDLTAKRNGWLSKIAGLKFFNVFGPNEYHKGDMRSVVNKAYPQVAGEGRMRLFKSYRSEYEDGGQRRDFIYVKDAVEMTLFFMERPDVNGIFNIGRGRAVTWNRVAEALFRAMNLSVDVEYIPMPETLRDKYQYYTCADMSKLKAAGCEHKCMDMETAVGDYAGGYLAASRCLGE